MLQYINLPNDVLTPVSPYCHAVRAGDFLFVTGQLAQNPETGEVVRGPIEDQTRQVMENLKRVLDHAGSSFDRVVMARVFITDLRFLPIVNSIELSGNKNQVSPCDLSSASLYAVIR